MGCATQRKEIPRGRKKEKEKKEKEEEEKEDRGNDKKEVYIAWVQGGYSLFGTWVKIPDLCKTRIKLRRFAIIRVGNKSCFSKLKRRINSVPEGHEGRHKRE